MFLFKTKIKRKYFKTYYFVNHVKQITQNHVR